jgi:Uma2 family endonuclease
MRAPRHRYTWDEYLLLERDSAVRHEFWDGEIYAMAGGTSEHAALAANLTVALGSQLRGGPCRVFSSDLRLRVQSTGLATYPDLTILRGPAEHEPADAKRTTVVNPTLLVEVLSDSTEEYDRGVKFEHYQQIPTLIEYVLVSQRQVLIEVFRRRGPGEPWGRVEARAGGEVSLESIEARLLADEVYARVEVA